MPLRRVGEWEWRVTNSEPRRWVEDIRQLCAQDPLHRREICWYQLNRRRLGGLRNRSGYCENDKILFINGVLLSEVAVDISVIKLTFPKNTYEFIAVLWLPQRWWHWFWSSGTLHCVVDLTYSNVSNEHSPFHFRSYDWASRSLEAEDAASF